MRVPVRRLPQTRISEGQQGFARAVQPLDLSSVTKPIAETVAGFHQQLRDEQLERQKFDANKRLMKEINELQSDFEERRRDPQISPVDFADTTNVAYEQRHQALLEELRGAGYKREVIEDLDLRLGTVRQGFYEKGLGHQLVELRSRDLEAAEELGVQASQYVATDYNNYGSAEDMVTESISHLPGLTESEREAKKDELLGILRDSGGKALAIQNPQFVIDILDPQGLTAPARARTSGGGAVAPANSWQGVATTVANELDLDPVEVAAVMSYETAGTFSPTIKGGKGKNYMGLIQFGKEERRKYGITESSTPEQWTAAILGFMKDRGFKRGMSLLDFYSTINAGSPGRYNASDGPGKTVRGHVSTLLAEHKDKASRWLASVETSPSEESEPVGAASLAPTVGEVKTGNRLLDAMNGPERLQVLSWAREQLNKVHASRKAEMDVTIGNITAEALNNGGEIATPLPSEQDVLSVYGPVEGPQRWAQIQQSKDTGKAIQAFRTRSATDIQNSLDAIKPKPGSPTYETELQIYQSAERAAGQLLQERKADPAAYAMKYFPSVATAARKGTSQYYAELDRVYETLGIDTTRAPLLSEETSKQLADDYKTMTPPQRREFIRDQWRGMGEDRFRRFASGMEETTIQEDARIFGLLKTYPGAPGEVAAVFDQVLQGRQFMAEDPARRPSKELLNAQFRKESLAAITGLDPNASAAIQEAAAALYVAKGGNPTKIDAGLYQESLRIALGGSLPVNMTHGGKVKDYTILPPKVNQRQFEHWLEGQTFESLMALSVAKRPPRYADLKTLVQTEDLIDQGVFVMTSPGWYMIKMRSDGGTVMTSKGKPFLVNINANVVNAQARAFGGSSGW